mmetsp:Transcript_51885/g.121010  ORF Transcript_51885/g.121010 Transcript_51885/m.121010 type:complete len:224 (-) Transcript_51885:182-853(-)
MGAERRNARSRGHEDHVGLRIFRQKHLRTCWASDHHVLARLQIADVAGAHAAIDLLRVGELLILTLRNVGILAPTLSRDLDNTLHHQGHSLARLVIARRGGGNGIQADLCRGLTLLVWARGDHTDRLTLDVWHAASMVHDHMACLPVHQRSLAGDGLLGDAAALVRCLRAEQVPWDLLPFHDTDALLLHSGGPALQQGATANDSGSCHGSGSKGPACSTKGGP